MLTISVLIFLSAIYLAIGYLFGRWSWKLEDREAYREWYFESNRCWPEDWKAGRWHRKNSWLEFILWPLSSYDATSVDKWNRLCRRFSADRGFFTAKNYAIIMGFLWLPKIMINAALIILVGVVFVLEMAVNIFSRLLRLAHFH